MGGYISTRFPNNSEAKAIKLHPGYYMYSNIYLQQFHIFNHTVMLIVKGLTAEDEKTLSIEE